MSFANSENAMDSDIDIVRYNFGYHSLNGFNETTSFVSSDNNNRIDEEAQPTQYWLNSPSCVDDINHGSGSPQGSIVGPHQIYTPVLSYSHDDRDRLHFSYDCSSNIHSSTNSKSMQHPRIGGQHSQSSRDLSTNEQILADHLQQLHHNHNHHHNPPFVRVVKRRTTANKKERRRTQSINNAYADLRDCINVPVDTKLSKIKTLRLALSYINYLTGILGANEDESMVIQMLDSRSDANDDSNRSYLSVDQSKNKKDHPLNDEQREGITAVAAVEKQELRNNIVQNNRQQRPQGQSKGSKGRTGWPQHLWAMELKQQQSY